MVCDGGTFKNPGDFALSAENLKAAGVFLRNGFSAAGEVDLAGAVVNVELGGGNGKFSNPGNIALNAEGLRAAKVFLNNGFIADGEVNLIGATLSGDLDSDGGTFKNPGNIALSINNLRATDVFLRNGFSADGEVDLRGATLSGQLSAVGGTFKNPGNHALRAESLKAGDVFFNNGFSADGDVDLAGATLAGDLDAAGGTLKNTGKDALNARGLDVTGNVYFRSNFRAVGTLSFFGAQIKGAFVWTDRASPFIGEVALDLRHATVGPFYDDKESWPQQGNLFLDGFVYGRIGDPLIGNGPSDASGRLPWLDLQRPKDSQPFDFATQPYEQLAQVLRENGDEAGAKRVLYEMENARSRYVKLDFVERLSRGILRVTIGYGYYTWRALWWIAGSIILGTFLFFWGHESEAIVQIDKDKPDRFLSFNPFVYSLETFLPLVELHQAKHWGPDPDLHQVRPRIAVAAFWPLSKCHHQFGPAFGKHLRWYLWFHILMGWFFTSMLIAGITGLVQKG